MSLSFDNMDRLDVMKHFQSDGNNADLTDNTEDRNPPEKHVCPQLLQLLTIPAFIQGQVFNEALNDLTPVPALKVAIKTALTASYTTGLSALVEILNFDAGR